MPDSSRAAGAAMTGEKAVRRSRPAPAGKAAAGKGLPPLQVGIRHTEPGDSPLDYFRQPIPCDCAKCDPIHPDDCRCERCRLPWWCSDCGTPFSKWEVWPYTDLPGIVCDPCGLAIERREAARKKREAREKARREAPPDDPRNRCRTCGRGLLEGQLRRGLRRCSRCRRIEREAAAPRRPPPPDSIFAGGP